jgi:HEXXH motif-containing protein
MGGPDTIRRLREAQQSKHLMLVFAIAAEATGSDDGAIAFRAGYELLGRVRAAASGAAAWLLDLPHLGGWAHDCLINIESGHATDFGHFACMAAGAAVRIGLPFELDVPVRDGRVLLPGLGSLRVTGDAAWIRLSCDGEHLKAGDHFEADWRLLVPDDGSARSVPHWSGTPMVRAVTGELAWEVLLETEDRYLDRYTLPMYRGLPARELQLWPWQNRIQSAWDILVRHHRWAAEPMAAGISVIVPLRSKSDNDLVSATSPAAFGAVATSLPPDPVTMAETLVHEFQHVKLGGLMDMVQLVESGREQVYAPWRQDPRPADVLLQGAYAHLGILRFWWAQRHVEIDPDDILRAQAQFARWRSAIELAVRTMVRTRSLTPAGLLFARLLRARGRDLDSAPVPGNAREIAEEAAMDHWLTWQIRHVAIDADAVESLAAAYQRGESFSAQAQPQAWIEEEIRTVDATIRSRLLTMRYLGPARYRELYKNQRLLSDRADVLLVNGKSEAAVRAYCDRIAGSADPQPEAWIGLALALHQLPDSPLKRTFAIHLALMFDLYSYLSSQGDRQDPLILAVWFK